MTRNETHVHDLSTLANFKDWAQSVNLALTAFGWTQSADTGQVNWGSIASVPASNAYVYEIWQPGDGKTTFFVRIDYGNNGGTTPAIKIQAGTTTNGAGTLTGFTTTQCSLTTSGNSGTTPYNCLFCGDSGSFSVMLWRDVTSSGNAFFGVDRSRDASGATTAAYFTLFAAKSSAHNNGYLQQSIVFGVGAAPLTAPGSGAVCFNSIQPGSYVTFSQNASVFNGNIALSPVFPMIGYFDNPTLTVVHVSQSDFSELAVLTTTMLGASHSFLFSKNQNFTTGTGMAIAMRWE
jgi:hypothetical protein